MKPIQYHGGQREVQREAGTAEIAERLTTVSPVREFIHNADLLVIAAVRQDTTMDFVTLSGDSPLVQIVEEGDDFRLQMPSEIASKIASGTKCGGLLINLGLAMRSRISGILTTHGGIVELHCQSGTRNCRKYIAPSVPIDGNLGLRVGPASCQPLPFDSPLITEILARAEHHSWPRLRLQACLMSRIEEGHLVFWCMIPQPTQFSGPSTSAAVCS